MRARLSSAALVGLSIVATAGAAAVPSRAWAGGFPVIDVANLGQAISDFSNQTSQLTEMIHQYEQLVREYELMVENLKGLDDPGALVGLLEDLINLEQHSPLDGIYDTDPDDGDFDDQVDVVYGEHYTLPPAEAQVAAELGPYLDDAALGGYQESYADYRAASDRHRSTLRYLSANNDAAEERRTLMEDIEIQAGALGPNMEMAALQLHAAQLSLMMNQLEQQLLNQDAELIRIEEQDRQRVDAALGARMRQEQRLVRALTAEIVERPETRWGDL